VPGARNIIRIPITEILGSMIVLVVTWLCLPAITPGPGRTIAALVMPVLGISASSLIRFRFGFAAAAVTLLLLAQLAPALRERDLFRVRTFFGVHRVTLDSSHSFHALYHGATLHGMQSVDPGLASMALTYYTESSPLNRLLRSLNDQGSLHRIAVVGLGTGALAAFGKPGQQIDFYEIDPAVARIASDPSLFSYLSHPAAEIHIILGDGRLELLSSSSTYDLIILDAFSSDAVPVHLLTTEAVRAYAARLAPGGLLVFNISSRYFDLASVIAAVARAEGLTSAFASDEAVSPQDHALGKRASRWAVVARSQSDLGPVLRDPIWNPPRPSAALPWTDDYSNIISVLRWRVQPATPPDPLSSQHGRP
jgi:spermidine synthase